METKPLHRGFFYLNNHMHQPRLYHLICDYGVGDPAFSEVIQRFHELDPYAHFNPISVPAFSTINTGFWIAQLAAYQPAKDMVVFSNTAPRHDDHKQRKANAGEQFVYAKLKNGTSIGVVNAGYALSFIKSHIDQINFVQTNNEGSQFRSRDFFPKAFYQTLEGQIPLGDTLDLDTIPDVPTNRIASIDGYGNIKTSTPRSKVSYTTGQKLNITINGQTQPAIFSDGTFEVEAGQIAYAPGSSGDPADPFLEVFLRRGTLADPSAQDVFDNPLVESEITIS